MFHITVSALFSWFLVFRSLPEQPTWFSLSYRVRSSTSNIEDMRPVSMSFTSSCKPGEGFPIHQNNYPNAFLWVYVFVTGSSKLLSFISLFSYKNSSTFNHYFTGCPSESLIRGLFRRRGECQKSSERCNLIDASMERSNESQPRPD